MEFSKATLDEVLFELGLLTIERRRYINEVIKLQEKINSLEGENKSLLASLTEMEKRITK